MAYQFVRELLRPEEAVLLCHACQTTGEKMVVWTLLDTVCVLELCSLTPSHVSVAAESIARQRQRRALRQAIEEKGRTDVTPGAGAARTVFQSQ
jgi:hypothetical protein